MYNLNENCRGGTFCSGKATLAIGDGAKTGPAITVTSVFHIDGNTYSKTGAPAVLPLTAAAVQPVLTKCLYLIVIDSAGAVTSVKGIAQLTADLVAGTKVLQWPDVPADKCPVGAVKITLASTATFTAGTTALDAANVTATYYDFAFVPTKPLTS